MELVLNGRTDLALKALRTLQEEEGPMAGASLAERIGTSPGYLPQVMAPMIAAGWARSDRGPRGGYRLVAGLDEISLLDVIEVYEGTLVETRCVLRGINCPEDDACPLHATWEAASRAFAAELRGRTVGELLTR